jgi:hypothetical protein
MTQTVCKIMGSILMLVGVAGFGNSSLLGMHLTPIHNIIHLASGALSLYFGFSAPPASARTFAQVFGGIYFGLALLGFVAPNAVAGLLGHPAIVNASALAPDNVVHLVLGTVFLAVGLAPARSIKTI